MARANSTFRFYPYAGSLYRKKESRAFAKAVMDAGYKISQERYLEEQPTEKAAIDYINACIRRPMLRFQEAFPDCARHIILNMGFMSIPQESLSIHPGVDFKVFLDMQMNLVANDPVFFGTYGVQWYHTAYADEEILRWSAKLNRHYWIEGKRERLTDDPYMLPHIRNPDFDYGLTSWELKPAEEKGIVAGQSIGYGHLQGRFRAEHGQGDKFLLTRRSAKAPNCFSQTVTKLTPGRLYSFRMLVTDYNDLSTKTSVERTHDFNETIDGVKLIPEESFRQVFGHMYVYAGLTGRNPLYMTYRRTVFRAEKETAELVISDWASDKEPGGPTGQQLAFNYIEIQPYLE